MSFKAKLGKPSYKMGLVFPSGTNRTLACSARAQDISVRMRRMRRIDQRTSAEYSTFRVARNDSILSSNLSSMEAYESKHTNVNAVDG